MKRPFDYVRQTASVSSKQDKSGRRILITKGAPESVLERCEAIPPELAALLDAQFKAGKRLIAIATRDGGGLSAVTPDDESHLSIAGLLTFEDRPKADAGASLARLKRLGVEVKIVTGDNDQVANRLCQDLGIPVAGTLTGAAIEKMNDDELVRALPATTIFARVTPEQKSRIIPCATNAGHRRGIPW